MKTSVVAFGFGALALAAGLIVPSPADAACTVANPNWGLPANVQQWIGNSSKQVVRDAHANNRCEIKSTLHQTGTDCIPGQGNNHVTVEVRTASGVVLPRFHVFDYTIDVNGTARQCTT